ncbi:MAG TPA: 1-phosphofructokinase [Pseudogracilibacillus sp.]|nr:1-phosphofructokinase [Pseudogracilibacillus sp.]
MIYTCTINPSIDYTMYLSELNPGALNRVNRVHYYPGGKGINVSRMLKRLGIDNIALGFSGGFTGEFIKHFLNEEGIETDFIETNETTRINVKIKSDLETELNGPGPDITHEQQCRLLNKLNHLSEKDWFVLARSLPNHISHDFYQSIAQTCKEKGAKFILDTSGANLKSLIKTKPFLMKPNGEELGEIFDIAISNQNEAIFYAKKLIERGVTYVIVSLGSKGAVLVTKKQTFIAEAPNGNVINTVGSGDSLVAGFIASFLKTEDPKEAFRYGVASGSATAFSSDLSTKEQVEKILPQIKIQTYVEGDE